MKTDRELLIELVDAVKMLTTCGDINLGDLIYDVREREGKGWEGPNVKQWSNGVTRTKKALKEADEVLAKDACAEYAKNLTPCKHLTIRSWRDEKRIAHVTFFKCTECDREVVVSDLEAGVTKVSALEIVRIKMDSQP